MVTDVNKTWLRNKQRPYAYWPISSHLFAEWENNVNIPPISYSVGIVNESVGPILLIHFEIFNWIHSFQLNTIQDFCSANKDHCPPGPVGPLGRTGPPGERGRRATTATGAFLVKLEWGDRWVQWVHRACADPRGVSLKHWTSTLKTERLNRWNQPLKIPSRELDFSGLVDSSIEVYLPKTLKWILKILKDFNYHYQVFPKSWWHINYMYH